MKTSQLVSIWFGIIMIVVIGSAAIAITFTDFLVDKISGTKRTFFVLMLYAYSLYRGIRIYQTLKQSRSDD
ncbi:MAG: hypothetical protein JNL60_14085 [Bacteroidia bacterium]|nr:hypothetical protein [Bacteroidia bacterium]